jgi:hypothetical protein
MIGHSHSQGLGIRSKTVGGGGSSVPSRAQRAKQDLECAWFHSSRAVPAAAPFIGCPGAPPQSPRTPNFCRSRCPSLAAGDTPNTLAKRAHPLLGQAVGCFLHTMGRVPWRKSSYHTFVQATY